jgi:lipopolysaccharide transport LptD-like protein
VKQRTLLTTLALAVAAGALASPARAQVIPGVGGRGRPGSQSPVVQPRETRPPTAQRDTGHTGLEATGRPTVSDSVIDALLKLQGYVPIFYNADSAEYRSADRTLRLRGASRVEREGSVITARDSMIYRDQTDMLAAYGNPLGTPTEGEPITGDVFFYDIASRRANVHGARTKITENATWYVAGDVTSERNERIYANNSTFTSDDRADPAYHFKADRIMIIRNRILVGRPAYLYFKNVPVMALPFIVQDLEHGRRSGFLIPQFEINDIIRTRGGRGNSRGTGREFSNIGYYWAMSPYLGLQLAGRWRSESYMAARANLEFNFRRHFLNGQIEGERFWETDGPGRLNLNGGAHWSMNERTEMALALGFASSTAFERNRVVDPFRQTADLSSNFSLTRRLDFGNLSLSAERRQSVGNDDNTFSPRFSLNVNPITLVRGVVLTTGFTGSETRQSFGDALLRRMPGTVTGDFSSTGGIQIGNFAISGSANYSHSARSALDSLLRSQIDTTVFRTDTTRLAAIPGSGADHLSFSVGTGYQINLMGSTRLTPTVAFQRELIRRDTTGAVPDSLRGAYGSYVAGQPRLNLSVGLATDLYGFFPGFGNYEAIRHHISPSVTYTYSPAVQVNDSSTARIQRQVFGPFSARAVNQLQLTVNQTFEAKVRQPRPVRGDSARDTANAAGNRAAPAQAQKVTLLAINTSAIGYSFVGTNRFNDRWLTPELSTTLRTDLLGGLQFTMSHSLFDQRIVQVDSGRSELKRGRFSPFLTSFSTGFTLGQNSALFRWLGFARATEEQRVPERGQTPDAAGRPPETPIGGANATANNQQAGGGPWSLAINYSLTRQRRSPADSVPQVGVQGNNSQIGGRLTFQPTRNWAVSWQTQYSTSTGKFAAHTINLKRDLYRWQANFDYNLAPNGNTSFAFSVHLIDLPDLKADYHESNLGVDRPARATTLPPP